MRQILAEHPSGALPWRQLRTLCVDAIYGGRVTDEWDRRTLEEMFARFCCSAALSDNYTFCAELPAYHTLASRATLAECQCYVDDLPLQDASQLVGMHHFANRTSAESAASSLLTQLRGVAPVATIAPRKIAALTVISNLLSNVRMAFIPPLHHPRRPAPLLSFRPPLLCRNNQTNKTALS